MRPASLADVWGRCGIAWLLPDPEDPPVRPPPDPPNQREKISSNIPATERRSREDHYELVLQESTLGIPTAISQTIYYVAMVHTRCSVIELPPFSICPATWPELERIQMSITMQKN